MIYKTGEIQGSATRYLYESEVASTVNRKKTSRIFKGEPKGKTNNSALSLCTRKNTKKSKQCVCSM